MSGLTRWIALLGVLVVAAAATVFVTGALDGGEDRVLPAAGDPIPVIGTVSGGEEVVPPNGGAASGAEGSGGGDSGSTADTTGGSAPDSRAGDSGAGAPGGDEGSGGAGGLGDLSRIVSAESLSELRHPIDPAITSPVPRFIDPCAGSEPGAGGGCGGEPGTILGEPRAITSPFHIVTAQSYPSPVLPRLRAGCARLEGLHPTAYDLRLVIESNNPADFTFTWGDPRALVTGGHASTPASERALWDGWTADGTAGATFGNLMQTCVLLRNVAPPAGQHWDLVVEGNDGITGDSARIWLDSGVGTREGRPPVEITPRNDSSIEVSVPMFLSRQIPVAEFFQGFWTTALESDELLVGARFPVWSGRCGFGVREFARRFGDFAVAGAVVAVQVGDDDRVERCAISLLGLGPTPLRATAAERSAVGQKPDLDADELGQLAMSELTEVPSDLHGSAKYRTRVGAAMVTQAWNDAIGEATSA